MEKRKNGTLLKYPITDEFLEFMRQNYLIKTNKQLLEMISQKPEWSWCNFGALTAIKHRYRFIKQEQVNYTPEEIQFVKDNYLTMGDVEMAQILGRKFKSLHKLRRVTLNLHRDKESLAVLMKQVAQKGHEGRARKMSEGTFYNPRYRLLGEIYRNKCSRNYWLIKPSSDKLSRPIYLHRFLWEREFGPVPKGYVIRFKNGIIPDDPLSITTDILECVTNGEHAQKVTQLMSDRYLAGRFHYKVRGIDLAALKASGLLDAKRQQIEISRKIHSFNNK